MNPGGFPQGYMEGQQGPKYNNLPVGDVRKKHSPRFGGGGCQEIDLGLLFLGKKEKVSRVDPHSKGSPTGRRVDLLKNVVQGFVDP